MNVRLAEIKQTFVLLNTIDGDVARIASESSGMVDVTTTATSHHSIIATTRICDDNVSQNRTDGSV